MRVEFAAIAFCIIMASGCESTTTSPQSQLVPSGVSIAELFSPPSQIELSQIETAWSQRDLSPNDVEEVHREVLPDGRVLKVVSHTGTGGKHFGAIISPAEGTPVPPAGFPIALALNGFGPPFELKLDIGEPSNSGLPPGITVTPSFRGYRLLVREQSYQSEGALFDFCDGGTDDILALLNVAIEVTPGAGELVIATGGSRGGTTAMLASIRDDRIKRVVSLAGPDSYLIDSYLDIPNMKPAFEGWFLKDLSDDTKSIDEARIRMISCSPLYFLKDIAPLQLHHGTLDINVPFGVLERVEQVWQELGRDHVELETYTYDGADHSFAGFVAQIGSRIVAFVRPVLVGN